MLIGFGRNANPIEILYNVLDCDTVRVIRHDVAHSDTQETRWKGIGMLASKLLLAVIFAEDSDNQIRLISARKAIKKEKEDYSENIRQIFGA